MQEISEVPEKLLKAVADRVEQSHALHAVMNIRTDFSAGFLPVTLALGPCRLEVWYKRPQWRSALEYSQTQWVAVWDETKNYCYIFANGRWAKREIDRSVCPDKLRLFGLEQVSSVTCASLTVTMLQASPVWVIQGLKGPSKHVWLVDKDTLLMRRLEVEAGFEVESREKKVTHRIGKTIIEFEKVELNPDVPDELFEVPRDAPFEEPPLHEKILNLFEELVLQKHDDGN